MINEQAKVIFYDGQRVRREDLEFLQNNLLQNQTLLGAALGQIGVCWGFKVNAVDNSNISVGEGLAYDAFSRPIINLEQKNLPITLTDDSLFVYVKYVPEISNEKNGQPVRVENSFELILYGEEGINTNGAVAIAQIRPREDGYDIIQKGEWYIPPLNSTHSGRFFEDRKGQWRYDGDPVVSAITPDFDSDWISLDANSDINIPHALASNNLLVQLQTNVTGDIITNKGNGVDFYYELHDTSIIRLFNLTDQSIQLNVKLWRLDAELNSLLAPVADAGMDISAEYGESFLLDGSDSIAFEGRSVSRYRWTLTD